MRTLDAVRVAGSVWDCAPQRRGKGGGGGGSGGGGGGKGGGKGQGKGKGNGGAGAGAGAGAAPAPAAAPDAADAEVAGYTLELTTLGQAAQRDPSPGRLREVGWKSPRGSAPPAVAVAAAAAPAPAPPAAPCARWTDEAHAGLLFRRVVRQTVGGAVQRMYAVEKRRAALRQQLLAESCA
jgi:hypothetical protein